jgi:hypothetical protein
MATKKKPAKKAPAKPAPTDAPTRSAEEIAHEEHHLRARNFPF